MPSPVSRVLVSCALFQPSMLQCTSAGSSRTMRSVLLRGMRTGLVINPPARNLPLMFFNQVALNRLRRLVENLYRRGGSGAASCIRSEPRPADTRNRWASRGTIRGQECQRHPRPVRGASGFDPAGEFSITVSKASASSRWPARNCVVSALPCQQGPRSANAGAVEGGAVLVFAVAVAVIAIPAGTLRQFAPQAKRRSHAAY